MNCITAVTSLCHDRSKRGRQVNGTNEWSGSDECVLMTDDDARARREFFLWDSSRLDSLDQMTADVRTELIFSHSWILSPADISPCSFWNSLAVFQILTTRSVSYFSCSKSLIIHDFCKPKHLLSSKDTNSCEHDYPWHYYHYDGTPFYRGLCQDHR